MNNCALVSRQLKIQLISVQFSSETSFICHTMTAVLAHNICMRTNVYRVGQVSKFETFLYLRQILADFRKSFTGTFCGNCV